MHNFLRKFSHRILIILINLFAYFIAVSVFCKTMNK